MAGAERVLQEEEEQEEIDTQNLFHPPSSEMLPKRRDAALEMYITKTRTYMESHLNDVQTKMCENNLPPKKRLVIKNLRQ